MLIPSLIFLFSFTSCDLDPLQGDVEIQTALDHFFAQSEFGHIETTFDIEAQNSSEINKTYAASGLFCSCTNIEVSENADGSFRMLIDYGTGCVCAEGRTRQGKLIGTFHGKWSQAGSYVDIVSDGYQVSKLDGTVYSFEFQKRITKIDSTTYSVKVENAVLTSDQGSIKWQSERVVEWTAGRGDADPLNNEYLLTGGASGTSIKGLNFNVRIEEPLKVLANCPHIVSGVLSLTPEGKEERTIDYGSGECDDEVILSIFGFSRTINLN
ncbi:MAG: hypothetical protein D6730_00955 [Bacteroidetes bacterium]|nr:MAG: hypothetical protein D6730_00955 [Bacteroidota bacterium]